MDLIQDIRRDYGLDFDIADVQAQSAVRHLQQNLENACRRYVVIKSECTGLTEALQTERRSVLKSGTLCPGTATKRGRQRVPHRRISHAPDRTLGLADDRTV